MQAGERSDASMGDPFTDASVDGPLDRDALLEEFAASLRNLRASAGLTYRQMARPTHYSYAHLSRASSGQTLPSWGVTEAYLRACGVGAADLHGWRSTWELLRDAAPAQARFHTAGALGSLPELESEFVSRLNNLRKRAGSPSLRMILARSSQLSSQFHTSKATLSDWLTGRSVPRSFEIFVVVLTALDATKEERAEFLRLLDRIKRARASSNSAADDQRREGRNALIAAGSPMVPSQLPLDPPDFIGRQEQLALLIDLVSAHDPVRPPIVAISGAPGTGKTSLAVRLGHLVREHFPDGQIYLDMHGATEPRDPAAALTELLLSLNLPDYAIPTEPDRRSAMLRSKLAGRRVLIILDDVATTRQVAPLMPGTGASAIIITSRNRLMDLAGADSLPLDTLDDGEAAALLSSVAGVGRIEPSSPEAAEILQACANLPLAIRIVGSRLAQRPDLTARELALRLRDETSRLDELSIGELTVRTSADLSYNALSPEEARLYRLIGHFAVGVFSAQTLEAIEPQTSVRRSLDRLIEVNLVQVSSVDLRGTARYRVHDLLRLHALGVGDDEQKAQAVRDVETVLNVLLNKVRHANAALPFEYFGVLEHAGPLTTPAPQRFAEADAIAWLDTERSTFVPAIRAAAQNGLHEYAWRIAAAWAPYLDMRAGFDDWNESHQQGLVSAIACGDRRGEAIMHRNLGQLALYQDEWDAAWHHFDAAAFAFAEVGDRLGEGIAAVGLGTWLRERGRVGEGLAQYMTAIEAFGEIDNPNAEALALTAAANACLSSGDTVTAARYLARAFLLAVRRVDGHREAKVRRRIAALRVQQGKHDAAIRQLRKALELYNAIPDDHCAAYTQADLGLTLVERGDLAAARSTLLDAIDLGHRLGDRSVEGRAAEDLGDLYMSIGDLENARRTLDRAAHVWQQAGQDARAAECRRKITVSSMPDSV